MREAFSVASTKVFIFKVCFKAVKKSSIEKKPGDREGTGISVEQRAVPPLPPLRALFEEAALGKGEAPAAHRDRPLRAVRRESPTGGMDDVTDAERIKEIAGLTVEWMR